MLAGLRGEVRAEQRLIALLSFGINIYMTANDDAKVFKIDNKA